MAEEWGVLDEVDVADNVRHALVSGALLVGPVGDLWCEDLVELDIGLGWLCAQESGALLEVPTQLLASESGKATTVLLTC